MSESIAEIGTATQEKMSEELDTFLSQNTYFFNKELKIDLNNPNNIDLFYVASISGNVDLLKKFIDSGFAVDSPLKINPKTRSILRGYSGFTGLHFAFQYHQSNAVQFLLNLGANIFIQDVKGITPVHILFKTKIATLEKLGSVETYDQMINLILQTNKERSNLENSGVTHFHIACTQNDPEIVKKFLQNRACINQIVGAFSGHEGFSPLHFAVKYKCVQVVQFLLEHGANVNQLNSSNIPALHFTDFPELVKLLLHHGADVTLKDSDGNTPLHKTFKERNFKIMDMLLTAHLNNNLNPINAIGISHFHIACTRNNEKVVQHFLDNGASINARVPVDYNIKYTSYSDDIDWRGCSPLHFAVAFNKSKIVELLLFNKANVKIQDAQGFIALHLACRSLQEKYEELIMSSLQHLEDAMLVDYKNRSKANKYFDVENALGSMLVSEMCRSKPKLINWISNREDHKNIVKLLLKYGSDVNCYDNFGNTPVFYAYAYYAFDDSIFHGKYQQSVRNSFLWEMLERRESTITTLLKHPVDLDICYKGGSILHYMVKESIEYESISGYAELEILKDFLRKGLTVDVLNEEMLTPLFILVHKTARTDFINLLIRCGANVKFREPKKHSSLLHAALENIFDKERLIFDEVLLGGAEPNAKQLDGTTALHYLAREFYDYECTFEKLFDVGVDIDARDAKGQTPLFRACLFWNYGLANLLLQNGADISIEDNEGKTVLCIMYEEKLLKEETSSSRNANIVINLFDVLLKHVTKKRLSVSDKVLSSRENVIYYLTKHVNKDYKYKFGDFTFPTKNTTDI